MFQPRCKSALLKFFLLTEGMACGRANASTRNSFPLARQTFQRSGLGMRSWGSAKPSTSFKFLSTFSSLRTTLRCRPIHDIALSQLEKVSLLCQSISPFLSVAKLMAHSSSRQSERFRLYCPAFASTASGHSSINREPHPPRLRLPAVPYRLINDSVVLMLWACSSGTASCSNRRDSAGLSALIALLSGESGPRLIKPNHERSEEHTSELQSRGHLVCRLLRERKKRNT